MTEVYSLYSERGDEYNYIKEPTLADAIMDRLTANARRIELKGQSLRRKSK